MKYFFLFVFILSTISTQANSMDSVIFSEDGDQVLMFMFKHKKYTSTICSEEWHIYNTGTNKLERELYIQGDMVTFCEYSKDASCYFYEDSCGISEMCVIQNMSLDDFLERYEFRQKWKRLDELVRVEINLKDSGLQKMDSTACGDLMYYKGRINLEFFKSDDLYIRVDTLIYDFVHLKPKYKDLNLYLSKAKYEERLLTELNDKLKYSFWIQPNGSKTFLHASLDYTPSYHVNCKEDEVTGELVMMVLQSMGAYNLNILR